MVKGSSPLSGGGRDILGLIQKSQGNGDIVVPSDNTGANTVNAYVRMWIWDTAVRDITVLCGEVHFTGVCQWNDGRH